MGSRGEGAGEHLCAGASVSKGLWYAFTAGCLLEKQRDRNRDREGERETHPMELHPDSRSNHVH